MRPSVIFLTFNSAETLRTPLAKAFLAVGGAICGEDFMAGGRTLASIGFGHLDRPALQALLRDGFGR